MQPETPCQAHDPDTERQRQQPRRHRQESVRKSWCKVGVVLQSHDDAVSRERRADDDGFNKATNYTEPLQYAALHGLSKVLRLLGAASRYKVMAAIIDTLVTHPNKRLAPAIEDYAEACTRTLREELPKHGIDLRGLMLQLEPGRAMHGNTGIDLTTVRNIKRMTSPIRYNVIVVDTTEFWFTGGRIEHHLHDYVFAGKADAPPIEKADIIGRSCCGDRLYPFVPVPQVEVGDVLAMLDTGAYQEVSMSNFNAMPRAATVLHRDHVVCDLVVRMSGSHRADGCGDESPRDDHLQADFLGVLEDHGLSKKRT